MSEKILRKTYEIIERSFTTEPKIKRIRRGHTIIIERCQQVMEHLWDMGFTYNAVVSSQPIENAVFYCVGGDYRTIKKYVGFAVTIRKGNDYEPSQTKRVPGYLEKLHYVDRTGKGLYVLRHESVPLPYHYNEELIPPQTPLTNVGETALESKDVLCVRHGEGYSKGKSLRNLAVSQHSSKNIQQQHNTHTNQLSESIPNVERIQNRIQWIQNCIHKTVDKMLSPKELRVLEACQKEGVKDGN